MTTFAMSSSHILSKQQPCKSLKGHPYNLLVIPSSLGSSVHLHAETARPFRDGSKVGSWYGRSCKRHCTVPGLGGCKDIVSIRACRLLGMAKVDHPWAFYALSQQNYEAPPFFCWVTALYYPRFEVSRSAQAPTMQCTCNGGTLANP